MSDKKSSNQKLLDLISGLSSALAQKHDTVYDADNEKKKEIGLKREDADNYITMGRTMDGFSARVSGTMLILSYHSELRMEQVHDKKFESEIESTLADIIKYIKKQYKIVTGNALKLTPKGKAHIKVETVSRNRSWCVVKKLYKIGGLELEDVGDSKQLDKAVEKWLSQKTDKKPKNVSLSKGDNDKED